MRLGVFANLSSQNICNYLHYFYPLFRCLMRTDRMFNDGYISKYEHTIQSVFNHLIMRVTPYLGISRPV